MPRGISRHVQSDPRNLTNVDAPGTSRGSAALLGQDNAGRRSDVYAIARTPMILPPMRGARIVRAAAAPQHVALRTVIWQPPGVRSYFMNRPAPAPAFPPIVVTRLAPRSRTGAARTQAVAAARATAGVRHAPVPPSGLRLERRERAQFTASRNTRPAGVNKGETERKSPQAEPASLQSRDNQLVRDRLIEGARARLMAIAFDGAEPRMADATETAATRRGRLPNFTWGGAPQIPPQRNAPTVKADAAIGNAIIRSLDQACAADLPSRREIRKLLSMSNASDALENAVWKAYETAVARIGLHRD